MFNKIYNKIKEYMKENYKFLIFVVILVLILKTPVNCYITTGGGIFKAKDRIEVENGYEEKGSLNLAYVSQLKGNIITLALSYIIPSYEREDISDYQANENESVEDIDFRSALMLENANNIAIKTAYQKAGKKIEEIKRNNYIIYTTTKTKDFKVGDELLEIDGNYYKDINEIKEYLTNKTENDIIKVKIKRKGKIIEKEIKPYKENDKLYLGIGIETLYKYKLTPNVKLKFKRKESGPSGGLMTTLEIYNQLVKEDITKGRKIVGTGTIEEDGTIGEIAGIKYKLKGAVKNKADIFLAPAGQNYKEAQAEKKKNKYKIKIIEVKTFDDALKKLSE